MEYVTIVLHCIVSLSILNVWLIRKNKATQWRGGNATTIVQEFERYGLPKWSYHAVGFLKIISAIGLFIAIWVPELTKPSAAILALLLLGSISMHLKIKDPAKKSIPALLFFSICLFILFF
jgi:hypothetical protein